MRTRAFVVFAILLVGIVPAVDFTVATPGEWYADDVARRTLVFIGFALCWFRFFAIIFVGIIAAIVLSVALPPFGYTSSISTLELF